MDGDGVPGAGSDAGGARELSVVHSQSRDEPVSSAAVKIRLVPKETRPFGPERRASGGDVRHHEGAGGSSVALPQLRPAGRGEGREEERAIDVRQVNRAAAAVSRIDVLDEDRPGIRAVAPPQLLAVNAVVGREEERAPHGRQAAGIGAGASGLMSLTSPVPLAVPSLLQSSFNC